MGKGRSNDNNNSLKLIKFIKLITFITLITLIIIWILSSKVPINTTCLWGKNVNEKFYPRKEKDPISALETAFTTHLGRPLDPIHSSLFGAPNKFVDSAPTLNEEWKAKFKQFLDWKEKGKKEKKTKKIVVTGLIRNAEAKALLWKSWVTEFVKEWADYRVVISENNSLDRTRSHLLEWSAKDEKVVIMCDDEVIVNQNECNLSGIFSLEYVGRYLAPDVERIQKMSILRNLYRDYICKFFSDFDYVLVIDFDLNGELFIDGLEHSLGMMTNDKTIHGVACNGMLWNPERNDFLYYDSFAHIDKGESYLFPSVQSKQQHDEYIQTTITQRYRNSVKPRQVESAFGGACLYRMKPFCEGKYSFSTDFLSCEHGHFHHNMNITVNPHMVFVIMGNNGYDNHS